VKNRRTRKTLQQEGRRSEEDVFGTFVQIFYIQSTNAAAGRKIQRGGPRVRYRCLIYIYIYIYSISV
jgi:hypothetical protein